MALLVLFDWRGGSAVANSAHHIGVALLTTGTFFGLQLIWVALCTGDCERAAHHVHDFGVVEHAERQHPVVDVLLEDARAVAYDAEDERHRHAAGEHRHVIRRPDSLEPAQTVLHADAPEDVARGELWTPGDVRERTGSGRRQGRRAAEGAADDGRAGIDGKGVVRDEEPKHVVSRNTIKQFQIDITRVMNKARHDTFFVLEGELFPLNFF